MEKGMGPRSFRMAAVSAREVFTSFSLIESLQRKIISILFIKMMLLILPGVILPVLLHPLHDGLVRVVWDGNVVGAGEVTKRSPGHHVEAGEGGRVVEARAGVVHLFSLLLTSSCDSHLLHFVIEGARWNIELLTHLQRRFSYNSQPVRY